MAYNRKVCKGSTGRKILGNYIQLDPKGSNGIC